MKVKKHKLGKCSFLRHCTPIYCVIATSDRVSKNCITFFQMTQQICECAQEFVEGLSKEAGAGNPVDIKE